MIIINYGILKRKWISRKNTGGRVKILLLNPPKAYNGLFVSREEYGVGTITTNFLPANIFLAAAYLREKKHDAQPIDAGCQSFILDNHDVVVVMIGVLHSFYQDIEWLRKAKEKGKKTVMILNDPHERLETETMAKFPFIDAAVRSWEREISLEKLILSWKNKEKPDFPGVIYRQGGQIIDRGKTPRNADLHHLTSYTRLLGDVPLEKYKQAFIVPSRGCPMPHTLCMHRCTGNQRRKIEDVISEIEFISQKIKRINFIDPAMLHNVEWMEEFCNQIHQRKIKIIWKTDINLANCFNLKLLHRIKSAGCRSVMFFTPSLDPYIGKKLKAQTSPQFLHDAVRNVRKAGLTPIPAFEIGLPWDSHETLSKIEMFLKKTPLPWFVMRQFRPWRDTPIYDECKNLGLLERELGVDDYVDSSFPIIRTLFLTKREVEDWKNKILRANIVNWKYGYRFFKEKRRLEKRHFTDFSKLVLRKNFLSEEK